MKLDDFIDQQYPPGTQKRIDFDKAIISLRRKEDRLERLLSWMRHIPIVGYLTYVFWWSLLDGEGWGVTDMVCFHYLSDAYVPTLNNMRHGRFGMGYGYRKTTVWDIVAEMLANDNQGSEEEFRWLQKKLKFIRR